jgi:hypothetical protein
MAQSIGGGGGNGGFAISASGAENAALSLALGGKGGAGGTAQLASVDSTGNITTKGAQADGIIAQSLGGGGGKWRFRRQRHADRRLGRVGELRLRR